MVRTIVQLTDEQATRLRAMAARRGVSMAAIVRQGVEQVLATDERAARVARVMALAGMVSGPSDLASRHDDYLDEIYAGVDHSPPVTT